MLKKLLTRRTKEATAIKTQPAALKPLPPMEELIVDLSLLAKAQSVTSGSNVHELNQIICIYTLGCNVFNRGLKMPKMPDYAISLREKALVAEQRLRERVSQLEAERSIRRLHELEEKNPRLAYFTRLLHTPAPVIAQVTAESPLHMAHPQYL